MAVLDIVDGLMAEILINGDPAHEYDDPDEIQVEHENHAIRDYQIKHTVSKYIESESGQNFSIRMKVGRPLGHANMAHAKLTMDIEVDGIPVWTLICDRPWFKKRPNGAEWEDVLAGPKEGKGRNCTVREFSFLKIHTSSDIAKSKDIKRQTERMKKKGTVVIRVYNANAGRAGGPTISASEENGFLKKNQANVSEKAVKGTAKSHAAVLGEAKKTARGPVFQCQKKDGEDYPVAIFKFIYRDLDSLQQMHVIPRDPSPAPHLESTTTSRAASAAPARAAATTMIPSMTPEQVLEMFNMWQRAQGGNAGIMSITANQSKESKIKEEHGEKRPLSVAEVRPSKKLKVDENGVVDLISDGEDEDAAATDAVGGNTDSERSSDIGQDNDDDQSLFVEQEQH